MPDAIGKKARFRWLAEMSLMQLLADAHGGKNAKVKQARYWMMLSVTR